MMPTFNFGVVLSLGMTAVGEVVLLAQQPAVPPSGVESITSGQPGLWFAIGGLLTAFGTTIWQPWMKERNTQSKLDEALIRIKNLEVINEKEAVDKQKAIERLNWITDKNIDLTGMLQRITTSQLVQAGRHQAGVPIELAPSLMIGDGVPAATGPLVLLVEDDAAARVSATTLLEMNHFRVVAVSTLETAMEAMERNPDFVILDLMLPDGDGTELLKRVHDQGLKTAVIVTTGKDKESWGPVQALGPLAVLKKPYNLNSIFALMRGPKPV